jgi:hypothetical protein
MRASLGNSKAMRGDYQRLAAARKRTFNAVRLLMRTRHVDGLLIAAILLISTASLYAQGQQQNVAKLKEDARNAVDIIGADRGKTQSYCQIVDLLGRQLGRADQEKNKKQTKALSQRVGQSILASGTWRSTVCWEICTRRHFAGRRPDTAIRRASSRVGSLAARNTLLNNR